MADTVNPADVVKQNQEVLDRGGSRSLSFGQMALQIPMSHLHALKRKYPDLASKDGETHERAWKKFARTTEAKPYIVSRPKYGLRHS
ncbi:MAG: hypothetical protein GY758_01040 [Fuerstiella sp.]|nr:hypothetical protein [Fuerstiella sp.]